jgi:hypothetical protein
MQHYYGHMNAVSSAIQKAVELTPVETGARKSREWSARIDALKSVRWVLRSGSMYVGPIEPATLESTLVDSIEDALVFDGRDNEQTKAAFFSRLFEAPFTAELL